MCEGGRGYVRVGARVCEGGETNLSAGWRALFEGAASSSSSFLGDLVAAFLFVEPAPFVASCFFTK